MGTPHGALEYAGSSSADKRLSVTGKFLTMTTIAATGGAGDYTLTATVTGLVNAAKLAGPSGGVSFVDTSDDNRVLGKAALGSATGALGFLNSSNPGTNPYPQSIAVADFNGDGWLDLAVPLYSIFTSINDVNVLLGQGSGEFQSGPAFALTGQNVNNIAVADFNGDGKPDLALSLPDASEVQVLLGNGDGSFNPLPAISAPAVYSVATADFNGDGNADLVLVNPGGPSLTILLGNGDGTFREGAAVPDADVPVSVVVGDFNGDGIPDLAVADYNGGEYAPSSVTIFLGNGDGTFAPVASSPQAGVEPSFITAADFNGDGILDLAVTNLNDGYPELSTVTILLGKGDGTFVPTSASPVVGSVAESVQVADVNGDGIPDLITANAGSNTVSVLLGNGDGTFAPPLSVSTGTTPNFAAVGDFNGDGLPDLAAANNISNTVTVLLSQETQTATASASGISPKGSGQHLVDGSYKGNGTYKGSTSETIPLSGNSSVAR